MKKRSINTAVGRRALIAKLMAIQSVDGRPVDMIILLERLCRAAVHNLNVLGVAVSLMSDSGSGGVLAGWDKGTSMDELQFTLGEGPSHDAFALSRPVLTTDLRSHDGAKWVGYSAAAQEAGVRAVFAFPLHIGAASFGVLTVYVERPGSLKSQQLTMALTFAEIATEFLLDEEIAAGEGRLHLGVETVLNYRAEIYQAQGAVMVDLDVSLTEALVRMRAHAYATDQSLAEIASNIMSGHLKLDAST